MEKVRPSLSAGRVQSVAVRLIVEREREIIAFRSAPYFRVVAQFYAANDPEKTLFKAELPSRFETQAEAEAFLRSCIGATFTVSKAEEKPAQRFPAPPFTTSTLQQEAGRKLGMSVSQTMSVAQHLYEQGLITYMRTDSVNLSQQHWPSAKRRSPDSTAKNIRRGITTRPRPRVPRRRTRLSARRISTASRSKAPRPKRNSTT